MPGFMHRTAVVVAGHLIHTIDVVVAAEIAGVLLGRRGRVFGFYTWDRAFLVEMVFVGITADQI
jgi:hypothetical protein